MNKRHNQKVYLMDILNCSKNCLEFTKGITFKEFENDIKTMSAIQHQLLIMGEAVKRLDRNFREKYPEIPWKKIAGTRDVLIHVYEEADAEIIWDIATVEISRLIPKIEKIVSILDTED